MSNYVSNTIIADGPDEAILKFHALVMGFDEFVEWGRNKDGVACVKRQVDTRWEPFPKGMIDILAKKFPTLTISLSHCSPDDRTQGTYVVRGNEVLLDKEGPLTEEGEG